MTAEQKTVAVVCSTYRAPGKESLTRLYGIPSLIEQTFSQTHKGPLYLVIVDDSPEPHPYLQGLGNTDPRIIYCHVPERNNIPAELRATFPKACAFIPSDADLLTEKWLNKLAEVEAWKSFLPFDYEFAKTFKVDMAAQVTAPRPTIGMKKNFGCMAITEKLGKVPDIFVYADDDDLRSPDYVSTVVKAFDSGCDFARMTKTYAHAIGTPQDLNGRWGLIDFQQYKDVNDQWMIPAAVMDSTTFKFGENGQDITRPVHDLYARNLLLAWPIISHDGALHNYRGSTWLKAAETFGGFFPTSFAEDIITFKKMQKNIPGFTAESIQVDQPHFIRCADGCNASDFYMTAHVDVVTLPDWAVRAVAPLKNAIAQEKPYEWHTEHLRGAGQSTAQLHTMASQAPKPR